MNAYDALDQLATECRTNAEAKGWKNDGKPMVQVASEFSANVHGEVSEYWEAYRRGTLFEQCDKATDGSLTCEEEELADIIIRTLDYAGKRGVNIGRAVRVKLAYNQTRAERHGGKLA